MKAATCLLLVSLVCGVWRQVDATTTKHFEMVYSWSALDYVFADEETRTNMITTDKTFIPGRLVPTDMAVESPSGRVFLSMMKEGHAIPATVATVSATKDSKGEHLLQPYPDWSWHTKGCDGITSGEQITIDECGRLWIMDTGVSYDKGYFSGYTRICPPQILIFDLKTDTLIKKFTMPEDLVMPEFSFATIVVDVITTENTCANTFAYIADSGYYGLIVYDFTHDDAWRVYGNAFFPYPDFGHFHIKGVHFDFMYGVYGMTITPKHETEDRTLFFNSFASGKMSYLSTSLLKNKTHFEDLNKHDQSYFVSSNLHTYPHLRPGGQIAAITMDSYGVMYFGSLHESSIYCWNSKKTFDDHHIVLVDKDEEKFETLYQFTVMMPESGVPELYVMSNNFQDFLFETPDQTKTHFRIMKAPLIKLIEGTTCMSTVAATTRK